MNPHEKGIVQLAAKASTTPLAASCFNYGFSKAANFFKTPCSIIALPGAELFSIAITFLILQNLKLHPPVQLPVFVGIVSHNGFCFAIAF
jgi:hypothetical protein